MVNVKQVVMSDRFKQRPKSNTGRTNSQLVYTSLIPNNESRRRTDIAWGTDSIRSRPLSSHLGISNAKIGSRHWTVNIGPDTGGFLPVLNIKRAETTQGRPWEKLLSGSLSKKHSPDQSNTQNKAQHHLSSGGNGTGTASMFDLATLVPPSPPNANSFISELMNTSMRSPRPPLSPRNSSENWSPSPEFKMASPDCEERKSGLPSSSHTENCEMPTTMPIKEILNKTKSLDIMIPTPPPITDKSSISGIKSPEAEDSAKSKKGFSVQSKPKPILKTGSENDIVTVTGKRPLSQTKFNIPLAPPVSSSPRKVNRCRTAHRSKKSVHDEERNSESGSKDEEISIRNSPENLQSGELASNIKSVRFCAHADQIKEYIPWEAPNSSLIHCESVYHLPAMNFSKFYEPFSFLDKKLKH